MRPLRSLFLIPSACLLAGLASAQNATGGQAAALRDDSQGSSSAPEADLNLSPVEQFRRGEEDVKEIEQASETVKGALEQARAARDVVKVRWYTPVGLCSGSRGGGPSNGICTFV